MTSSIKQILFYYTNLILIVCFLSCKDDSKTSTEPPANPCPDGNNTFSCADELQLGVSKQDKIDPVGDLDYFKFTINQPGVIEFALDPVPSAINMDVTYYDGQQNYIASWTGGNGQAIYFLSLKDAGMYYIKCNDHWNDASSNESYSIKVTLDISDTYELNNTFSQSKLFQLAQNVQGKIRPNGDHDYFKFSTPRSGIIEIAVDPVPSSINMDVNLYGSQNNWITGSSAGNGQGVFFIVLREAGLHYVRLNDHWDDANSTSYYMLEVTIDTSDIHEVNNAFSTSTNIPINSNIQGKIRPTGDYDYFRFQVNQGGSCQIIVNPVPTNINMDLNLYDSQQNWMIGAGGGSGQAVSVTTNLPASGTYYIKLNDHWDDANSTQFYTLRVNK